MSWVTNVIIHYSVGEEWDEETDDEDEATLDYTGVSPCLTSINNWLRERGWVALLDLGDFSGRGQSALERHAFECELWGAALNHLDIEAFLNCVRSQPWREPENVQVFIQDQMEERFTLYSLSEIASTETSGTDN